MAYEKGSCSVAEQVSACVITLPCHAGVSAKEAERTLQFLKGNEGTGFAHSRCIAKRWTACSLFSECPLTVIWVY